MEEYEKLKQDIIASKIYNCTNMDKFIKSIKILLPYRGYSASHFFITEINNYTFLTKLNFYRMDYPELYGVIDKNTIHQNEAEVKAIELLNKDFVDTKITPCIIRLIYYQHCDIKLMNITKIKNFCDKNKLLLNDKIENIVFNIF